MSGRPRAILQLLSLMALIALLFVLAKLALRDVPAFTFVWLQIAIGGVVLAAFSFGLRRQRIPRGLGRRAWIFMAWIGVCNFTIVRLVLMLGLERLPSTTHAFLQNTVGLVTMAMSVVMLREPPTRAQVAGAVLALAGLGIYFRDIPPPRELAGVVYVAIGVLGLASTNNVARKLVMETGERLPTDVLSVVAIAVGGIPVVLAGVATDWPPPVSGATNWAIIGANGAIGIAFSLTVFNHVLRTLRSYEASILASSSVIYVALFAVPILGERLALHEVVGIATMLAGLALSQARRGG